MKRAISYFISSAAILALLWFASCTPSNHKPPFFVKLRTYTITVPPWRKDVKRLDFAKALAAWYAQNPQFKSTMNGGLPFKPERSFYMPASGGHQYTVRMTDETADALRQTFRVNGFGVIVHPSRVYRPTVAAASIAAAQVTDTSAPLSTTWAAMTVVPSAVTSANVRVPRLYVVDSGVQPIVPGVTSGTHQWHPEFAGFENENDRVELLQGRLANVSLSKSWQHPLDADYPVDPTAAAPWNLQADSMLVWANQPKPLPLASYSSIYLDPQRDPRKHGTLLTSCAVGENVGVLGRVVGAKALVESIRTYPNGSTAKASTAAMTEGVYEALDAHLAAPSGTKSVLMFASRTEDGFDPSLEVALWWAWKKGMVCVVSAGNEPDPYASGLYEPNPQWFPAANQAQPNSPSRFDWNVGKTPEGRAYWESLGYKDPYDDSITVPDDNYLIMVGAHSAVKSSSTPPSTGDDWAPTASRGPGVDVLAPARDVPSANTTTRGLLYADGASLATGFVAGVALAYLSSVPEAQTTPMAFRSWLLPEHTPGSSDPIRLSVNANARQGHSLPSIYGNKMPVLQLKDLPD
ncbi:MAG: S8/S53 family peptidase [Verrucomicrobiaceae bacterium]|nr:S8/S53 family peptidase [Verrucomicrobiaceae bacterium]